jgi:hypothetical protein
VGNISDAAGLYDVIERELGVAFRHLDVGMPKQLGKLEEIAAAHHAPRSESMTEIVKTKFSNLCSSEQIRLVLSRSANFVRAP